MKKLLALFIALTLVVTTVTETRAISVVPGVMIIIDTEAYVFRHVIQTDDALFMASYFIDDTIWAAFSGSDVMAQLENEAGVVVSQKVLPHLGGGIIGFYKSPANFTSDFATSGFPEDARIIFRANPAVFLPSPIDNTENQGLFDLSKLGTDSDDEWINTSDHAGTVDDMTTRLPGMMNAITILDGISYLEGDKINLTGGNLMVEGFTWIVSVAPNAFILGSETLTPTFSNSGTIALQTALDASVNTAKTSVTDLAIGLGFNPSIFAFLVILVVSAPIILILREITEDNGFAFAGMSGMLVWWTSLGLLSVALIMTISLLFMAIIGLWMWNRIPTS